MTPDAISMAPSRLRSARATFLAAQNPTHGLTLCFNEPARLGRVRSALRFWHSTVDRYLVGRRFHLCPPDARLWFAAFPENLHSNAHAHLVLRVPLALVQRFEDGCGGTHSAFWTRVAPRGHSLLEALVTPEAWANYAGKGAGMVGADVGEWILSDEFRPVT